MAKSRQKLHVWENEIIELASTTKHELLKTPALTNDKLSEEGQAEKRT